MWGYSAKKQNWDIRDAKLKRKLPRNGQKVNQPPHGNYLVTRNIALLVAASTVLPKQPKLVVGRNL
jgi:hypothetical protein